MKFTNEYGNIFTPEYVSDEVDNVNTFINSILDNDQVKYVELGKEQLFDKIFSNYVMNSFLLENTHELDKHNFVVIKVKLDSKILSVSIGSIPTDDGKEYICGVLTE